MKFFEWVLVLVVLLVIAYNIWANTGKDYSSFKQKSIQGTTLINQGTDAGKGNIIGIQPYIDATSYCDQQHFKDALHIYFEKANAEGLLKKNSIVVLPEYIGSWLVTANEKATVYQADTIKKAIAIIVNCNIFSYIKQLLLSSGEDKIRSALFTMKAPVMAGIYQNVFASLSKEFGVTIVAGSILLPNPSVDKNGKLQISKGPLFNTSFIFGTGGRIEAGAIKKIFPTNEEKKFTASGSGSHPVVQTPAGKLAVLIGGDSWHPAAYKSLQQQPDIIAVPGLPGPDSSHTSPGQGPSFAPPTDLDSASSLKLNPGEDWEKYSLVNVALKAGIHNGVAVFFSGKLWEMHPKGRLIALQNNSLKIYEPTGSNGMIINVWLQ